MLGTAHLALVVDPGGPDDPPDWCFETNDGGDLPTCTYSGGEWHQVLRGQLDVRGRHLGGVAVLFVLVALGGVALTVWKVSTARRMAGESGMDPADATAMTLLSDDGFEATYLAANLRGQATPTAPPAGGKGTAERLRELRQLLDEGLITQEEYDARRRVVIGEV